MGIFTSPPTEIFSVLLFSSTLFMVMAFKNGIKEMLALDFPSGFSKLILPIKARL
ncbi:MAG: Uncharacterised protein [Flavobacteriaceae bacterium]|nr:MAG: Uncharacterised protein [Flavobacteriaceae bacterium]